MFVFNTMHNLHCLRMSTFVIDHISEVCSSFKGRRSRYVAHVAHVAQVAQVAHVAHVAHV